MVYDIVTYFQFRVARSQKTKVKVYEKYTFFIPHRIILNNV